MYRRFKDQVFDHVARWTSVSQQKQQRKRRSRAVRFRRLLTEQLEERTVLAAEFGFALGLELSPDSQGDLVTVDAQGNVYNVSRFTGEVAIRGLGDADALTFTSQGGYDTLLTKYTPGGDLVWAQQLGTADNDASLAGLCIDSSENVYLAGQFSGTLTGSGVSLTSNGSIDAFVIKLDSAGQKVWAYNFGASGTDRVSALAMDAAGTLTIGGFFQGTVDFDSGSSVRSMTATAGAASAFVLRLNTLGKFGWAKTLDGGGNLIFIEDAKIDDAGNIYLAGTFTGTPDFNPGTGVTTLTTKGQSDIFLGRYDTNGNLTWVKGFGNSMPDLFAGIALSPTGSIFLAASVSDNPGDGLNSVSFTTAAGKTYEVNPTSGATIAYVAEYDALGNYVRHKQFGGNLITSAEGIAVDAMGAAYVVGAFTGRANIDADRTVGDRVSLGQSDIFISKVNPGDDFGWSTQLGGSLDDRPGGIAVSSQGELYFTGRFAGSVDFDPTFGLHELTAEGSSSGTLVKLDQSAPSRGGAPDVSFGNAGRIETRYDFTPPQQDIPAASVVQTDQKIIVAGTSSSNFSGSGSIGLVRYLASGELDPSFGNEGQKKFFVLNADGLWVRTVVSDVLLDSQGRIIVTATSNTGSAGAVVVRFLANGSIDASFGTSGVRFVEPTTFVLTSSLLISGDRILLGGSTSGGPDTDYQLIQLTNSGQPDNTFGSTGIWRYDYGRDGNHSNGRNC